VTAHVTRVVVRGSGHQAACSCGWTATEGGVVSDDLPIPGSRAAAERTQLLTDLERARAIAVALEQENAELRQRMDAGYVYVRGMIPMPEGYDTTSLLHGDVVGQEGFPLGDPWEPS